MYIGIRNYNLMYSGVTTSRGGFCILVRNDINAVEMVNVNGKWSNGIRMLCSTHVKI